MESIFAGIEISSIIFMCLEIESFLVTDSKINNYQKGNWITNNIIKSILA